MKPVCRRAGLIRWSRTGGLPAKWRGNEILAGKTRYGVFFLAMHTRRRKSRGSKRTNENIRKAYFRRDVESLGFPYVKE